MAKRHKLQNLFHQWEKTELPKWTSQEKTEEKTEEKTIQESVLATIQNVAIKIEHNKKTHVSSDKLYQQWIQWHETVFAGQEESKIEESNPNPVVENWKRWENEEFAEYLSQVNNQNDTQTRETNTEILLDNLKNIVTDIREISDISRVYAYVTNFRTLLYQHKNLIQEPSVSQIALCYASDLNSIISANPRIRFDANAEGFERQIPQKFADAMKQIFYVLGGEFVPLEVLFDMDISNDVLLAKNLKDEQ
jgi:hypothetical protein